MGLLLPKTLLAAEPLPVRLSLLSSGPVYAGQAIEMQVAVTAGRTRPEVKVPKVEGAEVVAKKVMIKPLSSTTIGDLAGSQTNQFIFSYQLVPRRAGTLQIPAITARLGERTGASAPREFRVRDVPLAGRTSAFLGGVGDLAVEAEARPTSVRVGQPLEYRIVLEGSAAPGSSRRPILKGLERGNLGLLVEPLPDEETGELSSQVFRWRLRPTKSGEAVLPPVPIAHFDPKLGAYFTNLAAGVPIRVVAVPEFDAKGMDYGPIEGPTGLDRVWVVVGVVGTLALAAAALIALQRFRERVRARKRRDPKAILREAADRLDAGLDPAGMGEVISGALVAYLDATARRPPGALTPGEAAREVGRITDDPQLARRSETLIAACDRARFSGRHVSADALRDEARAFLADLATAGPSPSQVGSENDERHS